MRDLSLHLLDLAQNSIAAGAALVEMEVSLAADKLLTLTIRDDGRGMSPETLARVTSPFGTSRTTRKVGLGIPLIMHNARLTGGDVTLTSREGEGTVLTATFHAESIDCLPLGDLPGTLVSLVLANPQTPDFRLVCRSPKGETVFDTRQVRGALGDVPLSEPEVVQWMGESLQEEIEPIFGGVIL